MAEMRKARASVDGKPKNIPRRSFVPDTQNDDGTVLMVEGNTSRGNGVQREGDGVWQKRRRYLEDSAESKRVKGFLRVL
jgi:hypothetical protein